MFKLCQFLVLSLSLLLLTACEFEKTAKSLADLEKGKRIWVFAQFNVQQKKGIEDYYYFGQITETLYKKIKYQKVRRGFITLENVRYWTSDDTIKASEDKLYSNEMVFRIEDIRKIDLVKNEPKIGFKYGENNDVESKTSVSKKDNVLK